MTKKDYIAVAQILNHEWNASDVDGSGIQRQVILNISDKLSYLFKQDNQSFDRERFINAVRGSK